MPYWDKGCETLYRSFIWEQVGTDSDRAALSQLSRLEQGNRSDGRTLSIPPTSCTPAAMRGDPSTNALAGLNAPFASALSRHIPSSHNFWRTGHTGLGAMSPQGLSTNSCPTCGRFLHLRVTVSLNPLHRRSLLLPSDFLTFLQAESLWDRIPSSRSSCSTLGQLSNLGFATSSLPACANSKFQRSGEEH